MKRGALLLALFSVFGLGLAGLAVSAEAQTANSPTQLERSGLAGPVDIARSAHAGELVVPLNKSQLLRVDQPFSEISVGNPKIADVIPMSRQLVYVLGKELGTTNLSILDPQKRLIAVVDVVVSFDVEGVKAKLYELMPEENIEVRSANGSILLTGQVSSSDKLSRAISIAETYAPKNVTNFLNVGGSSQVLLEVRFAEVARRALKSIDASQLFDSDNVLIATGGNPGGLLGLINLAIADGPFGTATGKVGDFETTLDALEEKGIVRLLAEPNLVVVSGDTASFLAGGEFPIPIAQGGSELAGTAITVEFKQFGVGLNFTPTVVSNDLINLVLKTEVSEIDPTISVDTLTLSIPGLRVRRAETTVEMRDGQALAIAGLIQDRFEDAIQQYPWLADIPVLGALLRSTEYQRRQTELVILLVPRLIMPVQEAQLRDPTETAFIPTQSDMFLFGRTEALSGDQPIGEGTTLGSGGLDGPRGYILR